MDQAPDGVQTGGILAPFDFVNVSAVVTGVLGEFFLADAVVEPNLSKVGADFSGKIDLFLTSILDRVQVTRLLHNCI